MPEQHSSTDRARADRRGAAGGELCVADFLAEWLNSEVRVTVRPRTLASYSGHVRMHIVPRLGDVELAQLTPRDVEETLAELLEAGLSAATVQRVRATLRRALGRAVRLDLVTRNAAALARPPRAPRWSVEPFPPSAARPLLRAFEGHWLEPAVVVALATGLRQGEQRALRWCDIDLDEAALRVRYSLQRIAGRHVLVEPKTQSSRRTLHLAAPVVAALRRHREAQRLAFERAGLAWGADTHVFTNRSGGPLDAATMTHAFQRQLRTHGLRRMRWHDLRHACATLLIALGTPPRYVQEQLGHSAIAVTMDAYVHVLPAGMREAAEKLGGLFNESPQ